MTAVRSAVLAALLDLYRPVAEAAYATLAAEYDGLA